MYSNSDGRSSFVPLIFFDIKISKEGILIVLEVFLSFFFLFFETKQHINKSSAKTSTQRASNTRTNWVPSVKNNLRGIITLGIRSSWVIHPLILIFSWSIIIQQIRVSKNQFLSSTFGWKPIFCDLTCFAFLRCLPCGSWKSKEAEMLVQRRRRF